MSKTICMTDGEFDLFKSLVLERNKMTREEAEKKVVKEAYCVGTDSLFNGNLLPPEKQFVNALEALGLIKFDEPAVSQFVTVEDIDGDIQRVKLLNAIRAVEDAGYKVEKI